MTTSLKLSCCENLSTTMTSLANNVTAILEDQKTGTVLYSGGDVELKKTIKKVSDNMIIAILCLVMMSLGCTIECKILKAHFRRPIGLIIGLVCQFILFPATTFGLALALQLEKWHAVGMILLGTAPGGSVSNILTYFCDGEITLSVSMTAVSTLAALGLMPLNLWIYSRSWVDQETVVPYKSVLIGLASMMVPVAIGMLILIKFPKVAKWLTRVGSTLGMLMIIGVLAMNCYMYPHIFLSSWGVWVASCLLPLLGLTFGYVAATIFRQPYPSRRAIAFETSCQNVGLVLGLITISYGSEVYLQVVVFPVLFGTLGVGFLLILCGIYQIQKIVRRRLDRKKTNQTDDDESNHEAYDNKIELDDTFKEKNGVKGNDNSQYEDYDDKMTY